MPDWRGLHGDYFQGQRVLVTGGAGFIGSHITEALIELGASVVVLDDLSGGDTGNFAGFSAKAGDRLSFVQASVLDQGALAKAAHGCRWVYHEAALGSVPGSLAEPVRYFHVNVTGTQHVLEAARAAGVQRVVFAASSAAYGDSEELPKRESMPTLAKSPYAAHKIASEALLMSYAASFQVDTASLRYFNVFGHRQNANSAYAAVIAAFAKALCAGQRPRIFGDGEQTRDFVFIHNVVHANLLAARKAEPVRGRVFNIACGQKVTVNQLAAHMAATLGRPDLTPEHLPERLGDVKHSVADISLAQRELGYQPIVSFEDGLSLTTAWYRQVLTGK